MATFRSELQIPIKQGDTNFSSNQLKSLDNVQNQMDQRQQEWNKEFENLRSDFYALKPLGSTGGPVTKLDDMKSAITVNEKGKHVFTACFDVQNFHPDQIHVTVRDHKLTVQGRSEEKSGSSTVNRQYSRQVDLPPSVDDNTINCCLSKDGILTIEASIKSEIDSESVKPSFVLKQCSSPVSPDAVKPKPDLALATPATASSRCPIVTDSEGKRKLELLVDLAEFKPEEVVVETLEKVVKISASHEIIDKSRKMTKSFSKEYELPDDVNPLAISAYMQDNGKLVIEAPLKTPAPKPVYSVSQTHDTRRVVTTRQSVLKPAKPMITISVTRR